MSGRRLALSRSLRRPPRVVAAAAPVVGALVAALALAAPGLRAFGRGGRGGAAGPRRSQAVVKGRGNQVAPSPCWLPTGVRLLAFERIFSASESRVYVKRRRPGFGWSYGRPVPLERGDHAQRHPSLVCRPDGTVLLYVQVGDRRRGRGRVRVYQSRGDSLRFVSAARWSLPLPGAGPGHVSAPFAAPLPAPGRGAQVLVTVTRLRGVRDVRGGCYLGRSSDGLRPPTLSFTGPGRSCRTVALAPRLLVQTFVRRPRLTRPPRAYLRRSKDDGRTWSAPQLVSPVREAFDAAPVAPGTPRVASRRPGLATTRPRPGAARGAVLFVARLEGKSAVLARPLDAAGRLGPVRRLTQWTRLRWRRPAGLHAPRGLEVYVAREAHPLDFDVVTLSARRSRP